ncbi:CDP-glycerol glycerophosphotransferase family protein [Bacillus sp. D386]|uniref:CDP-glycerol glycerophosphotransferase family protein n=1 Tax=Bacillus sp. D386 TaxID=2587155 RepID=UPI001123E4A9|nr:CDP-glycerol glycerophosphotransferase family protein [Bacillus sp. D386]
MYLLKDVILLLIKLEEVKTTMLKFIAVSKNVVQKIERNRGNLFYRFFRTYIFKLLYYYFCLLPLKKKILFISDSRTEMGGNLGYIYEKLMASDKEFRCHMLFKESTAAKKTYKEMLLLAYNLATSKVIFLDDFYPMIYPLKIRKGAELIQVWHAVGAFKRFGFSRLGMPGGPEPDSQNHRNYTKVIVSSKNVIKHYADGFRIDESKVIATGIPRTDLFFDEKKGSEIKDKLYKQFPAFKDKKVILFAPTFRGNGQQSAYYPLDFLHLENIYQNLKDDYIFIFKQHPFVKDKWEIPTEYSSFFYDLTEYSEINDLLFISDLLITDYSSVCFEYALLNKPMLFYAPDLEDYTSDRDFYYDYKEFIPGRLATSQGEMIKIISEGDFQKEKIQSFKQYFFDELDGKASERIVDLITVILEK